ncbi:MAG: DMT family transporter [Actinomycetota bacterium]|nr:DMT family transporter [Actinomycetota bacterium]
MPGTDRNKAIGGLIVAAFLFGATFVVVKSALQDIGPLSFVAWRFLIGAVVLAAFAIPKGRTLWRHGALTGLALFAGYALQTGGLVLSSASNSALITGLYVVFTPFLAAAFKRRPPSPWVVSAAAVSFVGLFLLTDTDGLSLESGDLLTLGCALAFAAHIVILARYARHHPVIPFTTVQLMVTAALAFPTAFLIEGPGLPPSSVYGALALTGLGVSAGAFMLQVWAQTVIGPNTAAVVLAAEPAFGVAVAWASLGERLDTAGWIGAGLIVVAIYVVITKQRDDSFREAEAVTPAH